MLDTTSRIQKQMSMTEMYNLQTVMLTLRHILQILCSRMSTVEYENHYT